MTGRIDYGYETWSEKFKRKFNENPWVPLGCAATTGALLMSSIKMRAGKSKDMQIWLRARVVLQGLTIVALVAGSMALQAQRKDKIAETADGLPRNEATTEILREEKKGKDKLEFEERLKSAEIAHAEEKAAIAAALLNKNKGDGNGSSNSLNEPGTVQKAVVAVTLEEKGKSSGSWSKWLGWGSSSGSKSEEEKKS